MHTYIMSTPLVCEDLSSTNTIELHMLSNLMLGQIVLPPSPPRGSPGVRGKMCVIKKGGALEKKSD